MQAVAKALLQEFYSSLTGKQRLTNMLGYLKGQLGILVRSKVRHTPWSTPHSNSVFVSFLTILCFCTCPEPDDEALRR